LTSIFRFRPPDIYVTRIVSQNRFSFCGMRAINVSHMWLAAGPLLRPRARSGRQDLRT
jgi:hypothetical protein